MAAPDTSVVMAMADTLRTKPASSEHNADEREVKEVTRSRRQPKPEKIDEPSPVKPAALKPVMPVPASLVPRNNEPAQRPGARPGNTPQENNPPGVRRGGR